MQVQQNSALVNNFKESCLQDIKKKVEQLPQLKNQALQILNQQALIRIDQISKIFLDLEDYIVKLLRVKIKKIYDNLEKGITQHLSTLQTQVQTKIQEFQHEYEKMSSKIEYETGKYKKILSKFAEGKIQSHFQQFKESLLGLEIPKQKIEYDEQEINDQIQEILELLHVRNSSLNITNTIQENSSRITKKIEVQGMKNQSVISMPISEKEQYEDEANMLKQSSHLLENQNMSRKFNPSSQNIHNNSLTSHHIVNNNSLTSQNLINNNSFPSQKISDLSKSKLSQNIQKISQNKNNRSHINEQQIDFSPFRNPDQAILQHKQTKTIKKKKKIEQQILNQEKKRTQSVKTLGQLALQKQKLLKELL